MLDLGPSGAGWGGQWRPLHGRVDPALPRGLGGRPGETLPDVDPPGLAKVMFGLDD